MKTSKAMQKKDGDKKLKMTLKRTTKNVLVPKSNSRPPTGEINFSGQKTPVSTLKRTTKNVLVPKRGY